jgi:hypothetical protein
MHLLLTVSINERPDSPRRIAIASFAPRRGVKRITLIMADYQGRRSPARSPPGAVRWAQIDGIPRTFIVVLVFGVLMTRIFPMGPVGLTARKHFERKLELAAVYDSADTAPLDEHLRQVALDACLAQIEAKYQPEMKTRAEPAADPRSAIGDDEPVWFSNNAIDPMLSYIAAGTILVCGVLAVGGIGLAVGFLIYVLFGELRPLVSGVLSMAIILWAITHVGVAPPTRGRTGD